MGEPGPRVLPDRAPQLRAAASPAHHVDFLFPDVNTCCMTLRFPCGTFHCRSLWVLDLGHRFTSLQSLEGKSTGGLGTASLAATEVLSLDLGKVLVG